MPHLTIDIAPLGPIIQVAVGVSGPVRQMLTDAKQPLPPLQFAQALVDTGASGSVVDPEICSALGLSPVSYTRVHTPSTSGKPVIQSVYDVSIWLYHAKTKHIFERSFPVCCAPLRVQGIDMLLGRDVLSECLLVYDGPSGRFSLAF
ncbi:MAG: retropepsin-like aspartic protease [Phycisphaerales bacterium]